jgi:hypothetical protein
MTIEMKRIIQIHVPFTLICVVTIFSPVPEGAQIAWLSWSRTGMPPAFTLVADVTHWPVKQGPFAVGGVGRMQPVTA